VDGGAGTTVIITIGTSMEGGARIEEPTSLAATTNASRDAGDS
jgi:hypothetical protein